jgi:hypothetical protein
MTKHGDGTFKMPARRPLTDAEWEWVMMVRAITGGRFGDLARVVMPEVGNKFLKYRCPSFLGFLSSP